jgi:hypothetical protein
MDDDEQRVVAVLRLMYFVDRVPMREVVARLAEMGVVNRRGRPFGLSSVFSMIHRGTARPLESSQKRK